MRARFFLRTRSQDHEWTRIGGGRHKSAAPSTGFFTTPTGCQTGSPSARRKRFGPTMIRRRGLTCISPHLTAEARDTTAMTSLRWLAVLDVPTSTPARAKRLAPRPDGPLTHFVSPRGEQCRRVKSTGSNRRRRRCRRHRTRPPVRERRPAAVVRTRPLPIPTRHQDSLPPRPT